MKKAIAFLLVYLLVGVLVTQYRAHIENWSRGGPEIAVGALFYPLIYPFGEAVRLVRAADDRFFRKEQDDSHIALLSPRALRPLFREGILARRRGVPLTSYDALIKVLKRVSLNPTDSRTGFVLHQTMLATEALGDLSRARNDAAAFAARGDAASLRIAAAILGGAHVAAPSDGALSREILGLYEQVYAGASPQEAPFAAYALGTAYQACGMHTEALGCYRKAIRSGWIDLGMQATARALSQAKGDEARLEIVDLFASSPTNPREAVGDVLERRLDEAGWGDHSQLMWFRRDYEAALVLGRALFPLRAAGGAESFETFLATDLMEHNKVGRSYGWWEELIRTSEPAFGSFAAKLAMVERLLDAILAPNEERVDIDKLLYQRTREVYYRLYDETGDRRWLENALSSQLKVRPSMEKFTGYIRGEIAFMEGRYRQHFDLAERRYLEHDDYPSQPGSLNFIGKKMRQLEIRAGGETRDYADALKQYHIDLFNALYDKGVSRTDPLEDKLRLYEAGELPPPFHNFSDADVHAKQGG